MHVTPPWSKQIRGQRLALVYLLVLVTSCTAPRRSMAADLAPMTEFAAAPAAAAPSSILFNSDEIVERLEHAEAQLEALQRPEPAATTDKPTFPQVKVTGFFHLDGGVFDQDPSNRALLGDIQDGIGFRRARLQAMGNIAEQTKFSFGMDFAAPGRPSFIDVWGEQTDVPHLGHVRIGHFRPPLFMDGWTPLRQIWFLERSVPFQAFDPFRRVGIMAYDNSADENWSWAYGIYRTGGFLNQPLLDSRYATDIGDEDGISLAGRLTHLLWYDEECNGHSLLHVGGFYDHSWITGSNEFGQTYQSRAIPEFYVGDPSAGIQTAFGTPFFVDTGRLAADRFQMCGIQLAGQYGPAHFQAEYLATYVDQIGNPSLFYHGAYLQAGYFLTGEQYEYDRMFGVFSRVTPHHELLSTGRHGSVCGWGAWQVVARWSYVDLNDPDAVPMLFTAGPPPSPNPGTLTNITLGLNWYWNAYAKMQFNYIHSMLDSELAGDSACNIYGARFQVAF